MGLLLLGGGGENVFGAFIRRLKPLFTTALKSPLAPVMMVVFHLLLK